LVFGRHYGSNLFSATAGNQTNQINFDDVYVRGFIKYAEISMPFSSGLPEITI
jgi:hypothetical protein